MPGGSCHWPGWNKGGGGGERKKAEERSRGRKGGRSRAQAGAEQGSAEGAEEGSAVRRGGGWHSEERDTERERVGPIHLTPRAAYCTNI